MENARKSLPYVRVLGFNTKGRKLISEIVGKNSKVKLITSVKKYMDKSNNKIQREMLEIDVFATNIYTLGYEKDSLANLDYTNKLITL